MHPNASGHIQTHMHPNRPQEIQKLTKGGELRKFHEKLQKDLDQKQRYKRIKDMRLNAVKVTKDKEDMKA